MRPGGRNASRWRDSILCRRRVSAPTSFTDQRERAVGRSPVIARQNASNPSNWIRNGAKRSITAIWPGRLTFRRVSFGTAGISVTNHGTSLDKLLIGEILKATVHLGPGDGQSLQILACFQSRRSSVRFQRLKSSV